MEKKKALLCGSVLVLGAALMAAGFMTAESTGFFGGVLEEANFNTSPQYILYILFFRICLFFFTISMQIM